jgi:hypothetical protein
MRNCLPGDADLRALGTAFDKVNAVCALVNQRKKEEETRAKLLELQSRLLPAYDKPLQLVEASKRLQIEGMVQERVLSDLTGYSVPMYYVLLNDELIRARWSRAAVLTGKFRVETQTLISLVGISEIPENSTAGHSVRFCLANCFPQATSFYTATPRSPRLLFP